MPIKASRLWLLVQKRHDSGGSVRVESGGWLVQKQDDRTDDQFHPDVCSLPFTA